MNACYCPRGGDKLLRVMVHKNVGQNDLNIVRSLSGSRHTLTENNHILPLLDELHFGNIVFGVFPLLEGPNLSGAIHLGSLNSVDHIMHLLLQAFEVNGRRFVWSFIDEPPAGRRVSASKWHYASGALWVY